MRELALGVREAVGPDVGVAFDCHWRFDVMTALAVADAIAPARPLWLEDPVPPTPEAMAAVTARSPVPTATGENGYLVEGFEALLQARATHIVTPDVQKAGGMMESLRIGSWRRGTSRRSRRTASLAHSASWPPPTSARHCPIHLCLEFHGTDVPFWGDLVAGGEPIIKGGAVHITDAPGVGLELDLEVVRRYSAPGEPVFDAPPVR